MMSKKQWFVLLCIFSIYLLVGAGIFYQIESKEEEKKIETERKERDDIQKLLNQYCQKLPNEHDFFKKLTTYCGKPITADMSAINVTTKWDFYNSVFFVITVVSTIGYGNLAPTTTFSRLFMIAYGLIGIPMNGIVMVTLGDYFAKSFTKLYRRWKTTTMKYDTTRLGLISQVILYSIPGFTFFIILPSVVMTLFEGWTYDMAVYYSFVTLTTIGFGDLVAGTEKESGPTYFYYALYKMFLIIWIIGGLGYVIMILGFITRGMRSKKIQELEHLITDNIKETPHKIRSQLRLLLNEFLLTKVKRVYKHQFEFPPSGIQCTQSCPDLSIFRTQHSPALLRKRALSECPTNDLGRIQSDTDLHNIDKEMTFHPAEALLQQKDLLLKVVDALSYGAQKPDSEPEDEPPPDYEAMATRRHHSVDIINQSFRRMRRRAKSEVKTPVMREEPKEDTETTWYGQAAKELQRKLKSLRSADQDSSSNSSFFAKVKNKLIPAKDDKNTDIEKQAPSRDEDKVTDLPSIFSITLDSDKKPVTFDRKLSDTQRYLENTGRGRASTVSTSENRFSRRFNARSRAFSVDNEGMSRGRERFLSVSADPERAESNVERSTPLLDDQQQAVLENTSIADFLRALTAIAVPEAVVGPSLEPAQRTITVPQVRVPTKVRRLPIRPAFQQRRCSLMPSSPSAEFRARRLSLSPEEMHNVPPPPYTPFSSGNSRNGRFSVMPANTSRNTPANTSRTATLNTHLPHIPAWRNDEQRENK